MKSRGGISVTEKQFGQLLGLHAGDLLQKHRAEFDEYDRLLFPDQIRWGRLVLYYEPSAD
jgi:hypothetical protein